MSAQEVLTEAVRDVSRHGYTPERLDEWLSRLKAVAEDELPTPEDIDRLMQQALRTLFRRMIDQGGALKYHRNVPRFTLRRLAPDLRHELDRRILASADLIKLNREQAILKTLQRFSGWATSIPIGGSQVVDKAAVKADIAKSLRQMSFEERRVVIDQGHKLIANLNELIAQDTGAIAAIWRHQRQANYDGRPEHEARDGELFIVRDNWAIREGLMRKSGPYTDVIEQPAQLPFCRCFYVFVSNLRDLPEDRLTQKGVKAMDAVRLG